MGHYTNLSSFDAKKVKNFALLVGEITSTTFIELKLSLKSLVPFVFLICRVCFEYVEELQSILINKL